MRMKVKIRKMKNEMKWNDENNQMIEGSTVKMMKWFQMNIIVNVCKYYLRGRCKYSKCKYKHRTPCKAVCHSGYRHAIGCNKHKCEFIRPEICLDYD